MTRLSPPERGRGLTRVLTALAVSLLGCDLAAADATANGPSAAPVSAIAVSAQAAASAPQWASWSATGPKGATVLRAWWSPAVSQVAGDKPAVLMLHGCGGMLNKAGEPSARMREYAQMFNAKGWHALAVDSLTPRGETELCTQRAAGRRVKVSDRALDALSALDWLARQPGVDADRLAMLGWSNGGSTLLAATHARNPAVASHFKQASGQLKLAVAFYPGCAQAARQGYEAVTDTWLLLGEADDWTPAAECTPLASDRVHIRTWPGAGHGFDSTAPVRHRTDVPNGVQPGKGVHVGGQPEARQASQQLLVELLTQAFAKP